MTLNRLASLLEIVVDLDQYALVPELKRVFPDLNLDRWIDGRRYYLAFCL